MGVASLRQHIATLIDKPLLAIASHIHYDHAGGIHEFDRIAIHPAEAEALRQGDADAALCTPEGGGVLDEHFAELPYPVAKDKACSFEIPSRDQNLGLIRPHYQLIHLSFVYLQINILQNG